MRSYQAITTRYFGPGNVKGAKIIATAENGMRKIVPYDHSLSLEEAHAAAAKALCAALKWDGTLAIGSMRKGYAFVFVHKDVLIELPKHEPA